MDRRAFVLGAVTTGMAFAGPTGAAAQDDDNSATPTNDGGQMTTTKPRFGYAPVNGLEM